MQYDPLNNTLYTYILPGNFSINTDNVNPLPPPPKESIFIQERLRAMGRLDWLPQFHDAFNLMPIELRRDHPEWIIIDVQNMTMVMNYTFSWRIDQWGKSFKKIANKLETPRMEATDITFSNIPAQFPYYDIDDSELMSHRDLRWYWTYNTPPVLVYAPPYHSNSKYS